ncbi:DUF6639 family protein [Lutimaribacter saemankumensis]|uniref:Uncharacterized protein n=1 Tax=Lutimaribacter saemankumensis TaxID=490829 RepID=A0A1G8N3F5_9RHOB|nr:DUF6639 family protein [Lutimaribacter saemankumensis]SDI74626.1 hypothetical protein SAMN05421850_10549 [Lutimaribacter saemankumensis]
MLHRLCLVLLLTLAPQAGQAGDITHICATGDTVTAPDSALVERACAALATALPRLAQCHLPRPEPLSILVTDAILGDHPDCMGLFDCKANLIQVLPPSALEQIFRADSPYLRISSTLLFESLIVHEVTHALVYQAMGPDSGPRAQNEFMAYAMQYDFLPDAAREKLLEGRANGGTVTLESINGLILAMAPDAFAARVWFYFSRPENGCDLFGKLIRREMVFDGVHP